MHQYGSDNCGNHVENDVQSKGIKTHVHRIAEEPHRKGDEEHTAHQGIEHLLTGIKLQMLFISGADAGDTDKQEGGDLTKDKVSILVYHPLLDSAMDV